MTKIPPYGTGDLKLVLGEFKTITTNRVCKIRIETTGGSIIETYVLPNIDFKILPNQDIASTTITIEEIDNNLHEIKSQT